LAEPAGFSTVSREEPKPGAGVLKEDALWSKLTPTEKGFD